MQVVSKLKRRLKQLQSLVLKERRAKKERLALEELWELKLLNNKDSDKKPLSNRKEKKKKQLQSLRRLRPFVKLRKRKKEKPEKPKQRKRLIKLLSSRRRESTFLRLI